MRAIASWCLKDGSKIALNKKILDGDLVRKVQARLESLGFDPGPIDGKFGPKTLKAVLAFQKAEGLGTDGIVGDNTLQKLDLK